MKITSEHPYGLRTPLRPEQTNETTEPEYNPPKETRRLEDHEFVEILFVEIGEVTSLVETHSAVGDVAALPIARPSRHDLSAVRFCVPSLTFVSLAEHVSELVLDGREEIPRVRGGACALS